MGALVGGLIGVGLGAFAGGAIGRATAGQPGNQRSVDVQPVVFRNGAADPAPTGRSWSRRLGPSNTIWGKLGVRFNDATPVTIDNATLKTAGSNDAEIASIRAAHSDASRICIFLVDNDIPGWGGAVTFGSGASATTAMSDRGTSDTLLAHELGHVLGLGHPPGGADVDTIMTPSGSHSADNPTRNTIGNYQRISWPAAGAPTTIHPDS